MIHSIARTALAVTALALAGCGGDDDKTATVTPTAAPTQATATATATATQTQTQSTTPAGQREAVVPGKEANLESGKIGLNIKVTKVADPVVAYVDRAQKGKKLVGVFVEGQASGTIEPTRTSDITTLQTSDGKITGLRVIADGDCGGGFSIGDMLLSPEKKVKGCIGFEIPKSATPEAITIALATPAGTQQATWKLPKAQ